jgi:hypothetical protein
VNILTSKNLLISIFVIEAKIQDLLELFLLARVVLKIEITNRNSGIFLKALSVLRVKLLILYLAFLETIIFYWPIA